MSDEVKASRPAMNGADLLCDTLLANDVDVCFANPGTSEMHFVAALDRKPAMRCVLGLFEGVATGAADGYARMADKPAATLLHLGPGLANGLANLHNARRAGTPMVNIVGDHATYHLTFDAPLTIQWFADVGSPLHRDAVKLLRRVLEAHPGDVRIVFQHRPFDGRPEGRIAHEALMSAAEQGRFWELHDFLLARPDLRDVEAIARYVPRLGLDGDWREGVADGFTRKYGCKTLVWYAQFGDIELAIRREKQMKEWKRLWKLRVIEEMNPDWNDLFESLHQVWAPAFAGVTKE